MAPPAGLKHKSSEILRRINDLDDRQEPPTAFELEKLRREARTIAQVDAKWSWVLQGMVAVLDQDPDEMKKCHDVALNLAPNDPEILRNYAVSLTKMGFAEEALQIIRKAYKFAEGDSLIVEHLIDDAWEAGRVHEALSYCGVWGKLNLGKSHEYEGMLIEAARIFDSAEIDDDQAQFVQSLARSVLHEKGVFRLRAAKGVHADEESKWCVWILSIPRSTEQVVDLDMELIEKLIDAGVSPALADHAVVRYQAERPNGSQSRGLSKSGETTVC